MMTTVKTLSALAGDNNVIVVHRAVVEFLNDFGAARLLEQLLYWTPRAHNGWIAKSAAEWQDELYMTRREFDKSVALLKERGLIETKKKKFNGAPTVHYRVNVEELERQWSLWIETREQSSAEEATEICAGGKNTASEQMDLSDCANPFAHVCKSLTENTTDLNSTDDANASSVSKRGKREQTSAKARAEDRPASEIPRAIRVYVSLVRRYPPKAVWSEIANAVGDSEDNLKRWEATVREWLLLGWYPGNVRGMLDFFARGEMPKPKRNGNGNGRSSSVIAPAPGTQYTSVPASQKIDPAEILSKISKINGGK